MKEIKTNMHDSIKEFLKDETNPLILNQYFEDVYNYYYLQTMLKGKHSPVSRNKFSRDISLWGFKTTVCRDHQENGKCKRIITLPDNILKLVMRNVTSKKKGNL